MACDSGRACTRGHCGLSAPRAFQKAAIQCALKAFDARRRVRRFLVADEVGLGKTIVARGVIQSMMRRKQSGGPLRVFYVCSSLAIAAQNKASLLKVIRDPEVRDRAACEVDRLTLAPNRLLPADVPMHLYALTPDTSIPDRKGKHRSGTAPERALLHNLLASRYPSLTRIGDQGEEWLRWNAIKSWEDCKNWSRCKPTPSLISAFFPVLREQCGVESSESLALVVRQKLTEDPLETIKLLRVALAKTGLSELAPDLVIFDEFQRFQDLLARNDQGSDIAQGMVRIGRGGPAVLLLSATPYRLYGGNPDHFFGEIRHHEQFFELVEWLFGSDDQARERTRELGDLFGEYGDALRSADPSGPATRTVKTQIEERLRMIMTRTERFGHKAGQDATKLVHVPAPLSTRDLQAFRHMVECFTDGTEDSATPSTAVSYWSTVPLPMQTLGPDYKAWQRAQHFPSKIKALHLAKSDIGRFRRPAKWPHPKLRAMCAQFPPEKLALPWLPPSMPWWPLSGRWIAPSPGKALVFSRFRAVPRALAGLVSYDLERHLLRKSGLRFRDVTKRSPLGPQRENLAYFHPSVALARLVDPWRLGCERAKNLAACAAEQTASSLARLGVEIREGGRSRPLPELLVLLERSLGKWEGSLQAWRWLARSVARTEDAGETSLRMRVEQWDSAVHGTLDSVNPRELSILANAALSSPGSVLARSLERHRLVLDGSAASLSCALRASWEGVRSYLNNFWMDASVGDQGDYRDRISEAIVAGNFESVLDEHLWVTKTLRHLAPEALVDQLRTALSLRTSDVKLYGLKGQESNYYLRSHAALAFNQEVSRYRLGADQGKEPGVHSEEVRMAFNSPFWPYILATTSVGQEGLDFHTWCSSIVHWDLPGNPVDLEQREGRVNRYAGLSIRQVLAKTCAPDPTEVEVGCSPWEVLADRAEQAYRADPTGLAPWWIVEGAQIQRFVLDVPLSEAGARLEDLRQQRLLYRLTLGQPDQSDLVRALRDRVSPDEVVATTIDLSPVRL